MEVSRQNELDKIKNYKKCLAARTEVEQTLKFNSKLLKDHMESTLSNPYVDAMTKIKCNHNALSVEYKVNDKTLTHLNFEKLCYEILTKACSKNGIPAKIMHSTINQLNDELKYFSKIFFANSYVQVYVEEDKIKKKFVGTDKPLLGCLSGGEYKRAALCAFLARNALISKKSGVTINLMLFDESFVNIDRNGLMHVVQQLCSIMSDKSLYFIG